MACSARAASVVYFESMDSTEVESTNETDISSMSEIPLDPSEVTPEDDEEEEQKPPLR